MTITGHEGHIKRIAELQQELAEVNSGIIDRKVDIDLLCMEIVRLEQELSSAKNQLTMTANAQALRNDLTEENQRLKEQLRVRGERMEEMETLQDRLNNGIKYDEENNQYVVCWTAREIEQAQKEAEELMAFFKNDDTDG